MKLLNKQTTWLLVGLFCIFSSFAPFKWFKKDPKEAWADKSEKVVDKFIPYSSKNLSKKYGLKCVGTGAAMFEGPINSIFLAFEKEGLYLQNEARSLAVAIATDFVQQMNEYPKIQPYLVNKPCTIKNIEFHIFFREKDGQRPIDPYLCGIICQGGKINFFTKEKGQEWGFKTETQETYEQAVAILKGVGSLPNSPIASNEDKPVIKE